MRVFCPKLPDVESYYVTAEHVAAVYGLAVQETEAKLGEIRDELTAEMRRKFKEKRRQANLHFGRDGGGPATDALWPPTEPMTPERTLGKDLVPRINEKFAKTQGGRQNLLGRPSKKLVAELREFLM
jgi:hypothetical protein